MFHGTGLLKISYLNKIACRVLRLEDNLLPLLNRAVEIYLNSSKLLIIIIKVLSRLTCKSLARH